MIFEIARKQHNSKMCFVCGLKNSFGLKSVFYETKDNQLIGCFTPGEEHQSYPGRVHGGISSALLDEIMFRSISAGKKDEIWGVTIDLSVKYRKPLMLNEEIKAIARITKESSRAFEASAEIYLPSGELAVSATGKYLKTPLDKISELDAAEFEWQIQDPENYPKEIEIKMINQQGSRKAD